MDLEVALKGVLPSIGAALLLVTLGGSRLTALAAAIGVFVAHGLLKSWPQLPHVLWQQPNGTEWLVWAIATAALVALAEHYRVLPRRVGDLVGALAGAAAVWFVLLAVSKNWTPTDTLRNVGGGALIAVFGVLGNRVVMSRAPATVFPAVLYTLILSVDAAVLTLGRSALLGQLCGAVAAALGAAIGTAIWRRPFALTVADGTWLAIAHCTLMLAGVHLASLPWSAAGCALVAPLALLLLRDGVGSAKPVLWSLIATLLVAVPLGGAVWFVMENASSGY